ncbi:actin-binding Rho-activating protein [Gadus morhua]|uniref:Actin binding Rho activating protein a n=1 Tax=Gadus morhua TaxID=8049 RepID=A0A8C5CPP1_GADMO|nr:actin-binding Rho-activating protein-like [Gadus morhua]
MSDSSSSSAPGARPSFARVAKKVRCAAAVASLAKSWQGWANVHSEQQETIPSGWMPDSLEVGDSMEQHTRAVKKLLVAPRVASADADDGGKIRSGAVTKSVPLRRSECSSGDLISSILGKMETGPAEFKPLAGSESPTRRRQMRALQNGAGAGAGSGALQERKLMLQDKSLGSRSSSLDTEDSGLGEEVGLSDHSESKRELSNGLLKKPIDRPKIKVTTTGDIRNRWQQWSVKHIEGQKLNPFSEEFDHDHAMAQRLQKGDSGYGKPKEGSKTAERGERAQRHVHKEMEEMVWIIQEMGDKDRQGNTVVTFGRLFDRYVKISDKVVGILLRCRKHKMLEFEGEMLWKGQDDHVVISVRE